MFVCASTRVVNLVYLAPRFHPNSSITHSPCLPIHAVSPLSSVVVVVRLRLLLLLFVLRLPLLHVCALLLLVLICMVATQDHASARLRSMRHQQNLKEHQAINTFAAGPNCHRAMATKPWTNNHIHICTTTENQDNDKYSGRDCK